MTRIFELSDTEYMIIRGALLGYSSNLLKDKKLDFSMYNDLLGILKKFDLLIKETY